MQELCTNCRILTSCHHKHTHPTRCLHRPLPMKPRNPIDGHLLKDELAKMSREEHQIRLGTIGNGGDRDDLIG